MAGARTMLSFHSCESLCRDIHDSWGQLGSHRHHQLVQELACLKPGDCRRIREVYVGLYGEDLFHRLRNVSLSEGDSTAAACALALSMLVLNPHERDAVVAREALEQSDVNYRAIVEIFTCRKSSHVLLIQQAYQARFQRHLDQDIHKVEIANPYQKILMALSASHKAHNVDVSQHIAKCDARRLYKAGEGRSGAADEAVVLETLSKRSIPQLKMAFSSYKHIYGHSFTRSLRKTKGSEFEDALLAVVKCISNPIKHFAETLYASLKRANTRDKGALVRVMLSRAEVDMEEIQSFFRKKYGVDLKSAICQSIADGDYRNLLLSLASDTKDSAAAAAEPRSR